MAATPTQRIANHVLGDVRMSVYDVALDNSYATGGYALTAGQLGLSNVLWSLADVKLDGGSGSVTAVWYNGTTGLLKCYTATGEVANATDLSADTIQLIGFGY